MKLRFLPLAAATLAAVAERRLNAIDVNAVRCRPSCLADRSHAPAT